MHKSLNRIIQLFVTIFIITSCKKPTAPQYLDFQHLNINSIGLGESVVSADVRFYNPNNFKMKLKEAEVDVSVNEKFIGHSSLDSLMIIPKKDTFSIPVRMKVDMKILMANSILALLSNEVDLKMEGRAKVGKGGIFFNVPISYQGKQKLKLFQ